MDIIDEPADPFAIKQLVSLDSYLENCPVTPKEVQHQRNNNERETSVRKSTERAP
ncbi:hypothetical protein BDF20DRAFT_880470, partial [Mycotypha africana]|uniref:uncharacterized protein n=1 Tax=Mycotypha africana TaxID=64632 RepID=UPI0023008125